MALQYQTLYHNTTVHQLEPFAPDAPRYSQRYLLNDEFFGKGAPLTDDCPGPIFLYAGNEGPVDAFWSGNGFMQHLAKTYGGLLLFPEERYYGESLPSDVASGDPYFMTTQHVLEDIVEVLTSAKKQYNADHCPTFAFGGSYGGTLAAYLRAAYPVAVQGALASSSELGYYDVASWEEQGVDEFTFADVVAAQYAKNDGCLEDIWAATDAIEAATTGDLLSKFNFCDATSLTPSKSSMFIYSLEGLAQLNYPYQIGEMPAWPVAAVCEMLAADGDMLDNAAKVTGLALGYDLAGDCLPFFEEGPGNIPGDGPGLTAWGYQSCTEALHEFSSRGREDGGIREFDYGAEIGGLTQLCEQLYDVAPNTEVLTERYGGFDIAKSTSNTIFSVGLLDPWGGAGVKDCGADAETRGVHCFQMENGAHHLDLRGANDEDPEDVTKVREQEEKVIVGWMKEWVAARS